MCRVRRFGNVIEVLDAENEVGDDDENFRGDLHPYISVCANIKLPIEEADSSWIHWQPMVAA
jgi:phosphoribosyl 1,2-cyclic phosphodiesterase